MLDDVFSLQEAARYLKVSYRTAQRLAKKGVLPFFRVGGQWRIKVEDLEKYINETKGDGTCQIANCGLRISEWKRQCGE